ncbi:MAG TPA: hypothetical protein VH352_14540 [Pseudonocardiaceae bacterium]|jgi:hypothetical protein|nr:hypothetical protein [Pseudonocardiaceae bacterium]
MGSGMVWADNPEQTATQGRHRRDAAGAAVPAQRVRRASRHRRAEVGPTTAASGATADAAREAPPLDPLSDTGPIGLWMFNLGTIPASVTPPRTWRRAAWFTIIASAAALLGLLAVGAVLVGPVHPTSSIAGMPDFPSGVPLAAIGGTTSSRPANTYPTTVADLSDTTRLPPRHHPAAVPPATTADSPATTPAISTIPVDTSVAGGEPVIDPTKLIKTTKTFFAEVTSDAKAAADLTEQTVRDDALALIRLKYGDISSIQIQRIELDPNTGLTVSVLRVVAKDGTTTTQRTTLRFTLTDDPKITDILDH